MEQNREKVLQVELKLDCQAALDDDEWTKIVKNTAKTIEVLEKEHGYNRTQFKITMDNRAF